MRLGHKPLTGVGLTMAAASAPGHHKARHSEVTGHHSSFQTVQAYPACQQLQGLGQSKDGGVLPPRVSPGSMAALSLL